MKQFLKFMFASFLGTILTFIVIFLLFAGMVASLVAMSGDNEVKVKDRSVLRIDWQTPIMDRASENPFEGFDFATMQSKKPVGLNEILKNLDKAASDPKIEGIFLDMESIPAGIATSQEIRDKLLAFKETGKFIVSYANNYDQKAYYLASVANEIYLNPEGMILFKGLNAQVMFLKGLLKKLDIELQIVRGPDNKFKSAVEPLMYDQMSDANRMQIKELIDSMWGQILIALSDNRGISIADLNTIADNLETSTAEKAQELHFIDGSFYRDQVIDLLKEKTGKSADEELNLISFNSYTSAKITKEEGVIRDRIAVVYAQGDIVQGKGKEDNIGSKTIANAISEARLNKKVKAIVFRVNSGGGDAQASEIIRREVELAINDKPVIVSMGDMAASGGYWISTNADYIFAQPTTLTGSIGVFGIIPNMKGLFNNKLGITWDEVMTNKNSDFIDVMKPLSPFQHDKINESVIDIYQKFTALVARTRKLDVTYVDSIARGRVWTGEDAKKIGLIDEFGGLEAAIKYAAEKAELGDDYRIVEYPKRKDFVQQLMEELTGQVSSRLISNELGEYAKYYEQLQSLQKMQGIQARVPFLLEIN
ncbi:MAG: signal peptide peptidase SppA [Bacteroidales bacterium]|nr:signal peptide peptidase SppA [Bacteroidales bacterium]